ncbi:MAG: MGH1-like glycoside hydrolase domain-containing protein, partial [Solirubrobacteraceae bacterium]
MLRANWREGVHRDGTPYAYTCPATPRYRHQWHWDSCFHAIAWCRHDVQRAREELRTVLRGGRADGF